MGSRQDKLNWLMSQKFLDFIADLITSFLIVILFAIYVGEISFNVYSLFLIVALLNVAGIFSPKKLVDFLSGVLKIVLLFMTFLLFVSWWYESDYFGLPLTDSKMLVLITMAYVVTTYMLVKSQNDNFERSRLPILSFYLKNNFDLCIENSSNYMAREPTLSVQINYPLLECINPINALIWHMRIKKKVFELAYPDVFPHIHGNKCRCMGIKSNLEQYLLKKNIDGVVVFNILIFCTYGCDDIDEEQTYRVRLPLRIKVNKNKMELIS